MTGMHSAQAQASNDNMKKGGIWDDDMSKLVDLSASGLKKSDKKPQETSSNQPNLLSTGPQMNQSSFQPAMNNAFFPQN